MQYKSIKKLLLGVVAIGLLPISTYIVHGAVLEEIVVTAQKREERLMDVPISVSVVDGQKIREAGIQDGEDLSAYVPNFLVTKDPIGDKISIRGIQSGNLASFEQSVATFVDGIYRGRGTQMRFAFLDVEMVEVLRGPQPTLFGKNTVAGALNVRSARPTDEFEAEVSAGYNVDFDETEIQAHVSGPLSDNVRGRFVALSREMNEGWVENLAYDRDGPLSDEVFARASLDWDINQNTTASFQYEAGDFTVTGQPWVIVEPGPFAETLASAGIPSGLTPITQMGNNGFGPAFPGDNVIDFGAVGFFDGDTSEGSITVEHVLSNESTITAILGISEYEFERYLDADFGPLPILRFDDSEDYEQTSFEVRLASATGGQFEYIAGAYYQDSDLTVDTITQFNLGSINNLLTGGCLSGGAGAAVTLGDPVTTAATVAATIPGSTAALANSCGQSALTNVLVASGINGVSRYALLEQSSETLAIFAQPTWNINDSFSATLGLRYTQEDKEASQSAFVAEYVARSTTPLADQNPATSLAAAAATALGEFTPHAFTPDDPGLTRDESNLSWSLNFQWDISDDTMAYVTAGTGFKAGGFNSFFMGSPGAAGADSRDVDFEEEEVTTLEIGTKMTLLDGAAELNIAAYRSEYDDLQVSVFSGNTTFVVQNAASAVSQGIEIDGRWQVNEKLMLSGSLGYIDFEFDSFPNQACINEQFIGFREAAYQTALAAGDIPGTVAASLGINSEVCASMGINDHTGEITANTPELSALLSAHHVQPIGSNYELVTALDISYTDDVFRQEDLDPFALQEAFTKVNAALTFRPIDGDWDISIIGKNLTDKSTLSYVNDTPLVSGARQGLLDPPRNVTVRGRFRF